MGTLITKLEWDTNIKMDTINGLIMIKLSEIDTSCSDRYLYNIEAQEVKRLLKLKNGYLKTFSLNTVLNYNNSGKL